MERYRLKIKGGAVIAAPFDFLFDYESLLFALPCFQLCPVRPFDLNVNLQPFLECHCPCTSFLPHWCGLQAANVRRLSVCINVHAGTFPTDLERRKTRFGVAVLQGLQ